MQTVPDIHYTVVQTREVVSGVSVYKTLFVTTSHPVVDAGMIIAVSSGATEWRRTTKLCVPVVPSCGIITISVTTFGLLA